MRRQIRRLLHLTLTSLGNWPVIFLLFSIACLAFGANRYWNPPTGLTHFGDIVTQKKPSQKMETVMLLSGQLEADYGALIAGQEIRIYLWMYMRQDAFENFLRMFPRMSEGTLINGSERIDDYQTDYRQTFDPSRLTSSFHTEGTIPLAFIDSSKRVAVFDGRVIYSRRSSFSIGAPLSYFLELYPIDTFAIEIGPRELYHQIQATKASELIASIALAMASFGAYWAIQSARKAKHS